MIPATVFLVLSLWKRFSFKLPFIKNFYWSSDLLFCKCHHRFKCWKVKLDSFILTTGRASGSQNKMLKWQIECTLNVRGWVFRVVLIAGVCSRGAWQGAGFPVSCLPGSWSRGQGPCSGMVFCLGGTWCVRRGEVLEGGGGGGEKGRI